MTTPACHHVAVTAHRALLAVAAAEVWLMVETVVSVAAAVVEYSGFLRYLAETVVSAAGAASPCPVDSPAADNTAIL